MSRTRQLTVFVPDRDDQEFEQVTGFLVADGNLSVTCADGSQAYFVRDRWEGYNAGPWEEQR